jgi:signal transduction histidine kinase
VKSSAGALLHIIDDILDFSRIDAGRLEPRPRTSLLRPLLARRCRCDRGRARQKDLAVSRDVAPAVPDHIVATVNGCGRSTATRSATP